ncbi:MAG: GNAT family N-acetyltransferase [Pseudomonadota bacterium]|nr:GNAT family N-acetyltransferase [Pseudomonadota bacterium]
MIAYRSATPDDAAALAKLGADSFRETFGHLYAPADLALFLENHTTAAWEAELRDPAFAVRVAGADGAMIGYAKLGPAKLPFTPPAGSAELRQLYVLSPWHGAGVSAHLMKWVTDTARTSGATSLFLSVFTDNHRARRFYARFGFEPVGTYAFMVGTQADEDIVMRLAL